MSAPGGRLGGDRYELCSLLATGGMGQVWRARDTRLDRAVAVKVLRSEYTGDPTFRARFRAEARHAARLAHRNIAAVHDHGEEPAADGSGEILAWLVMDLVDGESLAALLARTGRLDAARTLDVLGQTAAALAAAHQAGVVHRDVKPGNVLVGADGVVRITDFGIAWSASDVPLTQTGQVVGTAQYLSPEQAEGGKAVPASDVYALGMVGYECLAGRRAFDGGSAVQIALRQIRDEPDPLPDDVPEPVRTLIARALVKDPARRFPDGAAFRDAVDDVLAGRAVLPPAPAEPVTLPLAVPTPSPAGPLPRGWLRRASAPVAALVAGAVIGIGGLQLLAGTESAVPPATAGTAPAGIVLAAADFLGRPVEQVEAALGALGLRVVRAPQQTAVAPAGTVTGLSPVGALSPGDRVTVTYALARPTVAPPTVAPPTVAPATVGTRTTGGALAVPAPALRTPVPETVAGAGQSGAGAGDEERDGDEGEDRSPGDRASGQAGGRVPGDPDLGERGNGAARGRGRDD